MLFVYCIYGPPYFSHIDLIDCGFVKKMQCNVLNIETVTKKVWFYNIYSCKICENYMYHESSDCSEYPKKSLLKIILFKKYSPKFSYPQKTEIKHVGVNPLESASALLEPGGP